MIIICHRWEHQGYARIGAGRGGGRVIIDCFQINFLYLGCGCLNNRLMSHVERKENLGGQIPCMAKTGSHRFPVLVRKCITLHSN